MNELEDYFQDKLKKFRAKRDDANELSEETLIGLLLCELQFSQLLMIKKEFPDIDLDPILERIIYIEARRRNFEPKEAFEETKKQMEERKLKKSNI